MQSKLKHLEKLAKLVGLEINIDKTKAMRINSTSTASLELNNQQIEFVSNLCYLGSIITPEGGAQEDIDNRLKKARAAFGRLQPIWRSSQVSRTTKVRIFRSCVKSVLTYGSGTWLTSKSISQKLQVFINRCLRIICRIFWPRQISNKDLWIITGEEPIGRQIRRRKWKWIGHTLRKPANNIAKMSLEWNPQGSRSPGRPRNTWRRSVKSELENADLTWSQFKQIAQNRTR
ncbi:uncharacterized protein LOC129605835 [Condylostylus longicornis]|uniref:uncharacterized protein LOC129605835 n=1 Tax=Condylostylus longicornis TaxID=2530218 RepID=UPI00244DF351|nr:uncharacterized protein LOC129605835 [Condylostylus longicornis]